MLFSIILGTVAAISIFVLVSNLIKTDKSVDSILADLNRTKDQLHKLADDHLEKTKEIRSEIEQKEQEHATVEAERVRANNVASRLHGLLE